MESKNYNFNLDPDKLSRQKVESHMDFDALLSDFNEQEQKKKKKLVPLLLTDSVGSDRKIFKLIKLASGALAAAVVGIVFYFSFFNNGSAIQNYYDAQAQFASLNNLNEQYIDPPFKKIEQKYSTYNLNAAKGKEIQLKNNGSKLIVPKDAFADKNGKVVKGDVKIKYIEHLDFIDIFVSGVPMVYDSAGHRYLLESAGMIEIYAEQNGERLTVNPEKLIQIELHSEIDIKENETPFYNVYHLNKIKRNWEYEGENNMEIVRKVNQSKVSSPEARKLEKSFKARLRDLENLRNRKIAEIEETIPLPFAPEKPRRRNKNIQSFDIDFEDMEMIDQADVEKMKAYSRQIWQPVPGEQISEEDSARSWNDIKVRQTGDQEFSMTLISPDKTLVLRVNPVLSDEALEIATNKYDEQMAVYESAMAEREAKLKAQKDNVVHDFVKNSNKLKNSFQSQLLKIEGKALNQDAKYNRTKVINRFKVDRFGIWNCDRPMLQDLSKLKARFVDSNDIRYDLSTAFIVGKNKNTVSKHHTYTNTEAGARLPIGKNGDHLMWLVTEDEKIAVFTPEEFKAINKKQGEYTFVMKVIDKKIESEEDVRKILHF